jgi:hypothetical protein
VRQAWWFNHSHERLPRIDYRDGQGSDGLGTVTDVAPCCQPSLDCVKLAALAKTPCAAIWLGVSLIAN